MPRDCSRDRRNRMQSWPQLLVASTLFAAGLSLTGRAAERAASSTAATPTAPPLPAIRSIRLEPDSLTFENGRDERRVLVWGETSDGRRFDLTSDAVLKPESSNVAIDPSGYLHPKSKGVG